MGKWPPLRDKLAGTGGKATERGRTFRGDVRSADWNGGGDLSGGKDTTATAGYLIDYSSGSAQFQNIYAEGGTFGDILSSNWNGSDPVDLSSGPDTGGTAGYALDASAGVIQLAQMYSTGGSAANPALAWVSKKTTGIYFYGSGADGGIGFSIGGALAVTIDASSGLASDGAIATTDVFTHTVLPTAQAGTTAVFYDNGTTYDIVPQSSTKLHKKNITPASELADIILRPTRYQRISTGAWEYGLIVEDLVEQDTVFGIWDRVDERFNDYDTRAVVAVLAAKVNRLESKMP